MNSLIERFKDSLKLDDGPASAPQGTERAPWKRRGDDGDAPEPTELLDYAPLAPDFTKLEEAVARKRLDEIAELVRSLTYGEMIELAGAIWKLKPDEELAEVHLPLMLHKWSKGEK